MGTPGVTGQVIELHRSGKMRILAVTSPTRLAAAPDIPTAAEQGFSGRRVGLVTARIDRKSTRLNSSHLGISYAVFCLKKKIHFLSFPDAKPPLFQIFL